MLEKIFEKRIEQLKTTISLMEKYPVETKNVYNKAVKELVNIEFFIAHNKDKKLYGIVEKQTQEYYVYKCFISNPSEILGKYEPVAKEYKKDFIKVSNCKHTSSGILNVETLSDDELFKISCNLVPEII